MHLGVIGYGSIAQSLVGLLPFESVPYVTVFVRASSIGRARAEYGPAANTPKVTFVTSIQALIAARPAIIVECAGHSAVVAHAVDVLNSGIDLVVASVGAFADASLHSDALNAAAASGARLIVPTGAIGGLDLLRVLSAKGSVRVSYRGIKPPAAWKGSPADTLIDLDNLKQRKVFFTGTARATAIEFPKNANVVAALALAGAGFDEMTVELMADPFAEANIHSYDVISPLCSYKMHIENTATPGNARTSMTTVLSILQEVMDRT
jgi:aspartate dehydrogenase